MTKICSETTIEEFIDFDAETITSEPAVDPGNVDWRQSSRNECISQVLHPSDEGEFIDSDEESFETEVTQKVPSSSKVLLNLDEVVKYVEVNGDKELNILLNEVVTKVERLKLKNLEQKKD